MLEATIPVDRSRVARIGVFHNDQSSETAGRRALLKNHPIVQISRLLTRLYSRKIPDSHAISVYDTTNEKIPSMPE